MHARRPLGDAARIATVILVAGTVSASSSSVRGNADLEMSNGVSLQAVNPSYDFYRSIRPIRNGHLSCLIDKSDGSVFECLRKEDGVTYIENDGVGQRRTYGMPVATKPVFWLAAAIMCLKWLGRKASKKAVKEAGKDAKFDTKQYSLNFDDVQDTG